MTDSGGTSLTSFNSNPKNWNKSKFIHQIEVLTKTKEIEKETIGLIKKEIEY